MIPESKFSKDTIWQQPLWDYASGVYESPELKAMLHTIQNDYSANVNIALWCTWLELNHIEISKETIDDVLIAVDSVSQTTVSKVREIRQHIKRAELFTKVQTKLILKYLLNTELMIEKILIQRLQDLSERFAEVMPDSFDPLSLEAYLEFMDIPDAYQQAQTILSLCKEQLEEKNEVVAQS